MTKLHLKYYKDLEKKLIGKYYSKRRIFIKSSKYTIKEYHYYKWFLSFRKRK